jgi:hypothetical protein
MSILKRINTLVHSERSEESPTDSLITLAISGDPGFA